MNRNKDRNMSLKVGSITYIYIYILIYVKCSKSNLKNILGDDFDTSPNMLTIV